MIPIETVRTFFPYIETGRIYLNHASTAPLSTYVSGKIQKQLEYRSRGAIEDYRDTVKLVLETKQLVGEMLHCSHERIAFAQNTSDGLNIIAGGIHWKSGDRILLNDIEFPCNVYPFLNQKRHGVEVDFIRSKNGIIDIEDIERAITPRTRLLSISWVQFLSGFKCDLNAIGDLCKEKGVIFCVDAIQGICAQQIDLSKLKIDFLASGAQKWMLSPQGIAIVYVSKEMQSQLRQQNVGWLGVKNSWDFFDYNLDLLDTAQRYEGATYNPLGIAGLNGALHLFRDAGYDFVEKHVNENASYVFHFLEQHGFDLMTPKEQAQRAGIVTFRHEKSENIFKHLCSKKIDVSHRVGAIRISAHFYNTKEELKKCADAICNYLE